MTSSGGGNWWQQLKKWWTAPLEPPRWTKPTPLVVLGFVVALGGLFYLVIAIPQWQTVPLSQESLAKKLKDLEASPSPQPNPEAAMTVKDVAAIEKGRLDTENAFRTALIQGIGGTVLLIGLYL